MHHSRNLRLHRLTDTSAAFFITKSLHPKKPILDKTAREIVVSAFAFAVQRDRIYLRAFRGDAGPLACSLRSARALGFTEIHAHVDELYRWQNLCALRAHQTSWQDGYYDTRVKTSKQFEFVASYIEQNQVAKGLVEKADEWDASSARRAALVTEPWPCLLDDH